MNPAKNRRAGSQWETDLVNGFRGLGLKAEHVDERGRYDEGDLTVEIGGVTYLVEAKNAATFQPGPWLGELEDERYWYARARNIDKPHGLVIAKRRNHSWARAFALMELTEWYDQVNQVPF